MISDKKIGIVGHFGGNHTFLDGQTVKTKILYEELTSAGYKDICCVDTYYNQINKIKLLWESVKCILRCKTIIILLSGNGMKVYFPMMYYAKKILKRRIFHDVIGGNLASYVQKYPQYVKYLSAYDGNWVEFDKMKTQLENHGIHNCTVIPNFKRLNNEEVKAMPNQQGKKSFCMFSRVMEEKGITDAIEAIGKYNEEHKEPVFLNIWGPVDDRYKEAFEVLLQKAGEYVKYHGSVNYDESVKVLTNHLALLFPTHWDGEGFPGTIVDAYAAGIPVIASDWNANSELVDNFKTGWIYPNEKVGNLYESIEWAVQNEEKMMAMRKDCKEKAAEYTPETVMNKILEQLEK